MKICVTCGAHVEDVLTTCPRCGEASWIETTAEAVAPSEVSTVRESPVPENKPAKRRR